jgi:hypothetical protein
VIRNDVDDLFFYWSLRPLIVTSVKHRVLETRFVDVTKGVRFPNGLSEPESRCFQIMCGPYVGCSFDTFIPEGTSVRSALSRLHRSMILATELLSHHVRRCIQDCSRYLEYIVTFDWLPNAYKR